MGRGAAISEALCAECWRWRCPDQTFLELISGKEGRRRKWNTGIRARIARILWRGDGTRVRCLLAPIRGISENIELVTLRMPSATFALLRISDSRPRPAKTSL